MSENEGFQLVKNVGSEAEEYISYQQPHKSRLHKIGLTRPCFHLKTEFCKHDLGCVENTLTDAIKSFLYGYGIRTLISLIKLLIKDKILNIT